VPVAEDVKGLVTTAFLEIAFEHGFERAAE
jgi:hypothetical protein